MPDGMKYHHYEVDMSNKINLNTGKKLTIGSALTVAIAASFLLLSMSSQAGVTSLNVSVPSTVFHNGDIFNVEILLSTPDYVKAWECKLSFDTNVINVIKVTEGNIFSGYDTFFNDGIIDNNQGNIINLYNLILGPGNVTGSASIVSIRFEAIGTGLSNISLYDVGVTNETMYISSSFINNSIFIFSQYDVNCDRVIDLEDIITVALHYGQTGAPGWIPEDVNNDGEIRILDLVLVAVNWGYY